MQLKVQSWNNWKGLAYIKEAQEIGHLKSV